jgi:diguanylate cyclase (GGDEF)-like protein
MLYLVAMTVDRVSVTVPGRHGQDASVPDELRRLYDRCLALYASDPRAAISVSDELYAKAAEAKSPYWQALSRYTAGFSHYILSEYDKAIEEFDRGDRLCQENKLSQLSVKFRNGYGVVFGRIGWYDKAMEQFGLGLEEAKELDLQRETGALLVNLGELSLRLGNRAESLAFETEAASLVPKVPDSDSFGVDVYYNLAEAQVQNGLMEEAEDSYRHSLDAALRLGDTTAQIEARVRLGSIIAGRGQEAEALPELEEALRLSRLHALPAQEIQSLLALADIEERLGRLEEASGHIQSAVSVAEGHKTEDLLPSALEALSSIMAATQRYEEAYRALQRSVDLAHTFSGAESSRRMAELAAGYRLDKAKHEAEVERSRREGLESANERLRMVARIGRSLTESLEPREILRRMWEELSAEMDIQYLSIGFYERSSGIIEFPGWINGGAMQDASSVYLDDESSLAALCVREKRSHYYATASEARRELGERNLISPNEEAPRVESILYLPLFRENDIVGVMTAQSVRSQAFSADAIEVLEAVASFAAIAVENARIMISLNEANQLIAGEKDAFEQAARESSWLADHDSLTGLYNRRFLERVLDENIRLATLNHQSIAVFFIDLDNFKKVNDEHGHEAGDRLLVSFSQRLLSVFRENDYVARVGGDEFIVVAPGLKEGASTIQLADKLIASFQGPPSASGASDSIGITVGIAFFPDHGKSSNEVIDRADEAMYSVKRSSKGTWRLWSKEA